jgi:hypothetical protein
MFELCDVRRDALSGDFIDIELLYDGPALTVRRDEWKTENEAAWNMVATIGYNARREPTLIRSRGRDRTDRPQNGVGDRPRGRGPVRSLRPTG